MKWPVISKQLIASFRSSSSFTLAEKKSVDQDCDRIYASLTEGKSPIQQGLQHITMAVGATAAGKSTLLRSLAEKEPYKTHGILIDNDLLRGKMRIFQEKYRAALADGMENLEADRAAYRESSRAVAYGLHSLINHAQRDGYHVLLPLLPESPAATDIRDRAQRAGVMLTTHFICAAQETCLASARRRAAQEGRLPREDYIRDKHAAAYGWTPYLIEASHHVKLYWRDQENGPPVLAAETNEDGIFNILNQEATYAIYRDVQRSGVEFPVHPVWMQARTPDMARLPLKVAP